VSLVRVKAKEIKRGISSVGRAVVLQATGHQVRTDILHKEKNGMGKQKKHSIIKIEVTNEENGYVLIKQFCEEETYDDDVSNATNFQEILDLPKGKYSLEIKTFTEEN
jgi:hypothetical protein